MNPTEYCKLVENRLGWTPPYYNGWKTYAAEVGKVRHKRASNPALYTWDNLLLAVELLAREKKERTPIGVFAHVQRALDLSLDREDDIELEIRNATEIEVQRGDPDDWSTRFARAVGGYRREALEEWRASRGQVQP